jgi:hypothetical protein
MSMGPNFICIGAQRAGTTWLHSSLNKHPQLWLTPIKELHHFDAPNRARYFKHLKNRIRNAKLFLTKWDVNYFLSIKNDDQWYASLFKEANDKNLVSGEITPAYAILEESDFHRIKNINPNMKIIFLMRNPIDRLWSAFLNAKRKNKAGFKQADIALWAADYCLKKAVLSKSSYIDTINTLEKVFDQDKIFYGFYDDIVAKPEWLIEEILRFLEVNVSNIEEITVRKRVNGVGNGGEIPSSFIKKIAPHVIPSLEILKDKFDTYPSIWLDMARSNSQL